MDFLDKKGLREKTMIIFTSDHGQQYFDHGFNDKHNFYEETWRVPLILSLPGTLPQGKVCGFAGGTDIAPTIIGAAGGIYDTANGFDLFTPLSQGKEPPRTCAAACIQQSMAVVTQDWKLIFDLGTGEVRLFYLRKDKHEDFDVSARPAYSEIREQLEKALLLWRASMLNTQELGRRMGEDGPVAKRAAGMLREIKGCDCELQLAKAAAFLTQEEL